MADASRFPQLAAPFAITGAAAGWLSASLCSAPVIGFPVNRPIAAACAAAVGAFIGALFKRLAGGRRYWYEVEDPEPTDRPGTDRVWIFVPALLLAGAVTALLVLAMTDPVWDDIEAWAVGGVLSAAAFVPVCLAVLEAGRRAQRARLGSIVARSDRRAVWGILAPLLAVMTVETLPEWPLVGRREVVGPLVVVTLLVSSYAILVTVLRADRRDWYEVGAVAAGLSTRHGEDDAAELGVPRTDLGLGDQVLVRTAGSATAYRDHGWAVAVVRGSPHAALGALRRARIRGAVGLAVTTVVLLAHAVAASPPARAFCAEWCGPEVAGSCTEAPHLVYKLLVAVRR